jgi:hypothetical protein
MSGHRDRIARVAFAAFFAAAALSHAVAALRGEPGAARHAVFVGINAAMAVFVVAAPRLALMAAVPLGLQQIFSHGAALVAALSNSKIDWSSVGVLLFFPALVAWLAAVARQRRGPR